MQAQVKYESEVKTAVLGDRTITVKNLTPVFSPQGQDKAQPRGRAAAVRRVPQVCRAAGVGRSHPCGKGAAEVQYTCRLAPTFNRKGANYG